MAASVEVVDWTVKEADDKTDEVFSDELLPADEIVLVIDVLVVDTLVMLGIVLDVVLDDATDDDEIGIEDVGIGIEGVEDGVGGVHFDVSNEYTLPLDSPGV